MQNGGTGRRREKILTEMRGQVLNCGIAVWTIRDTLE
jgi:hypothetical protein